MVRLRAGIAQLRVCLGPKISPVGLSAIDATREHDEQIVNGGDDPCEHHGAHASRAVSALGTRAGDSMREVFARAVRLGRVGDAGRALGGSAALMLI